MQMKKSYQLKAGNLKNLKIKEEPLDDPTDQEVQVEVRAVGLNFADVFAIWGLYSATPKGVFTPGLELSGVVRKVGAKVSHLKEGDSIMAVTRFGGYTSHINLDASYAIPLPNDWSFQEGAAYLVQALTAYYGLNKLGNFQENKNVLIHSAAGGVGIFATRIAKKMGAKMIIGSVGNETKIDLCKAQGCTDVIVRKKNFAEQLASTLKDEALDVVMECIGGKVLQAGYEKLGPEGRMIVYGSARYAQPGDKPNFLKLFFQFLRRPKIDPQLMIEFNKGILGFNLIYLYERASLMHELLGELKDMNIGKPLVGHQFDFDDLPNAVRLFQTGKTMGKIVVNLKSEDA